MTVNSFSSINRHLFQFQPTLLQIYITFIYSYLITSDFPLKAIAAGCSGDMRIRTEPICGYEVGWYAHKTGVDMRIRGRSICPYQRRRYADKIAVFLHYCYFTKPLDVTSFVTSSKKQAYTLATKTVIHIKRLKLR